jgi:hypothetical protein
MVGQGGGKDVCDGLFVKVIGEFCMEDLEKDKETVGCWVINGGVNGMVAVTIVFIVERRNGFIFGVVWLRCVIGFILFVVIVVHRKVNVIGSRRCGVDVRGHGWGRRDCGVFFKATRGRGVLRGGKPITRGVDMNVDVGGGGGWKREDLVKIFTVGGR